MVVSNIFYFHPYLGKIPILTSIFFNGVVQPPTSPGGHTQGTPEKNPSSQGADIHVRNRSGQKPLHIAKSLSLGAEVST